MRNYKKIVCIAILGGVFALAACGRTDNPTVGTQKENVSTNTEKETDISTESAEVAPNIVVDGFYNCVDSKESRMRIDFEVKTTDEGYIALFYSKYSDTDTYGPSQILHGVKTGDNLFEFTGVDESYTISWDGADKIRVEGTWFSGEYERGVKDGYGEDDYEIADAPSYEADKNVESGIEIDTTLAHAIRTELGYSDNEVLTYDDLESVTYLAPFYDTITSIKGISQLKNLQEIHINDSYISDISELAELEDIRFIDIYNCYVTEIPDLSGCSNLESLYLGGNMIEDIAPVADIWSLKYVDLNCNNIRSIEPLKDSTNLEMLCIENNCILDYYTIKENDALIAAYNHGSQGNYEMALAVENRAKEIAASFPAGLSELELEKVIYQYVINNMYFDDSLRDAASYGYQGIMEGWGVCGDYAEAFALLANHAGLEAYDCSSETHAWNIVKIDGVYYHCDTLWDEDVAEWAHFNKSTGYIKNLPDHEHDLRRYPICEISMSVLEYYDCFTVE